MHSEFDDTWDKRFEEYWLPLLQTNGQFDLQKIKNEMHDLVFCTDQVSIVYSHVTGGRMSYPSYFASDVISQHDEEIHRQYSDGYDEGYADGSDEEPDESYNPDEAGVILQKQEEPQFRESL